MNSAARMLPRMLLLLLSGLALALVPSAASAGAQPLTIRSRSGQFAVRGAAGAGLRHSLTTTGAVDRVQLDAPVLAVMCEDVKQALLQELGASDQWRGPIQINLHPVPEAQTQDPIRVISVYYTDGWAYRVEMPSQVDRHRLLKAVIEVLLREMAQRQAGPRAAELPPWLAEGLIPQLEASSVAELAPELGKPILRRETRREILQAARERLRRDQPLTLDQMNWPEEKHLSGEASATYRACAHLMVSELLRLKKGRQYLREMLPLLPNGLNWQTAFLGAFRSYFPALIDFDKWWALTVVNFTGRDQYFLWPRATTLARLAEIVTVPVQVRLRANELPANTRVKLQQILAEWDYARQQPILRQKLNHLQALRLRALPEYAELIGEYQQVLLDYIDRRDTAATQPPPMAALLNSRKLVFQETVDRLNQLDAQRVVLAKQPPLTPSPDVVRSP